MKSIIASRFAILVALGLASTAMPAFADSGAVPGCSAQKSDQEQLGENTGPAQRADQEQLGENTGPAQKADQEQLGENTGPAQKTDQEQLGQTIGPAQKADQEQLGNGQYKVASNANPC